MTAAEIQPAHSELGGSVIKRLKHCPGARKASRGMPNESSEPAAEGTVAHGYGEAVLRVFIKNREAGIYGHHLHTLVEAEIEAWIGRTVVQDGFKFVVSRTMARHVRSYWKAILSVCSGTTEIEVETRFDLSALHEGMFGTSDCTVYLVDRKILIVIDLKYGEGVEVDAEDNYQLLFYALGALLNKPRAVESIEVCIFQPRSRHGNPFRRWSFPATRILEFMAELKEIALATEVSNPRFAAGEWCQFCPAAPLCPTLASFCDEALYFIEKLMDNKVPDYDPKHVDSLLRKIPIIKGRLKAFEAFMSAEKRAGRGPSDHKIVEGQSRRAWRDPQRAAGMLQIGLGLDPKTIYAEAELRSPAQMEDEIKNLGIEMSEDHWKLFNALIIKPQGGLQLVPSESEREEVQVVPVASLFTSVQVVH